MTATTLFQFTTGSHVVGFRPGQVVVAALDHALRIEFADAADVTPVAASAGPDKLNAERLSGQATPLGVVSYPDLWRGIDIEYRADEAGNLKSTYTVAPGADPAQLRLRYNVPVEVQADGSLRMAFSRGALSESAPIAWQESAGGRVSVAAAFTLEKGEVGFRLGTYDPRYPLIIDPTYEWHTFYGGTGEDHGYAIAVDESGNVYIAGKSYTSWRGDGATAPLHAFSGSTDIVVVSLSSTGDYRWHTFYGMPNNDVGNALAVDENGNVYVAGYSSSAWQGDGNIAPLHAHSGGFDIAVLSLSSAGAYRWHTFYGGTISEYGYALAVDGSGNVYVAGKGRATWQGDGNTAPVHAFSGGDDNIVVLSLNSVGDYRWHTFYGAWGIDRGYALAVDESGNVYMTGASNGPWHGDGGASPRHAYNAYSGNYDISVLKLSNAGIYQWHTFYGGTGYEEGSALAVDGSGNVYVAGRSDNPWQGDGATAPLHAFSGYYDITILSLSSAGDYRWHTFYGGTGSDVGNALVVDGSDDVYVAGISNTTWWGDDNTAPCHAFSGKADIVVVKLSSMGDHRWHTFQGGTGSEYGNALALDGNGNVYVAGATLATWQGNGNTAPRHLYSGDFDILALKLKPAPDLVMAKKVAPAATVPGQQITYTLTIANTGDLTATHAIITDVVPISVTLTSVISSGLVITQHGGTRYAWDVADLLPGAGGAITITGILSDILPNSLITNTATVMATSEGSPGNNVASAGLMVQNLPIAVADTFSLAEDDGPSTLNVLDNDSYALRIESVGASTYGGVSISGTTALVYTPTNRTATYTDTFAYMATSGAFTDSAIVTVTVTANNDAPLAVEDAFHVVQDGILTVPLPGVLQNDVDPDANGSGLSVTLQANVSRGTLHSNGNGAFSYTPTLGFTGTDTFTYIASDGVLTDTAIVTLAVQGPTQNIVPVSGVGTYPFGAGICGSLTFTDTGTVNVFTVTLTYTYPSVNRDGLPRRYDIEADGSGFNATLTLCYEDNDLLVARIDVTQEPALHAYRYVESGQLWQPYSRVDTFNNMVAAFEVTEFGVWGLGIDTNHPTAVTLRHLMVRGGLGVLELVMVLGCIRLRHKRK